MHPGSWGPAEWTAAAALGTFIVALVAGALTFWQVLQAKRLYRDQVRPFVIVDFAFNTVIISISVENIGTTPARDVSIKFDPPLRGPQGDDHDHQAANAPMFARGIPMMAPGREMRVMLGGPDVLTQGEAGKIPLRYEVTATYTDLEGRKYHDPPLYLDLSSYNQTEVERRPVVDALKGIERAIKDKRIGPTRSIRDGLLPAPFRRDVTAAAEEPVQDNDQ